MFNVRVTTSTGRVFHTTECEGTDFTTKWLGEKLNVGWQQEEVVNVSRETLKEPEGPPQVILEHINLVGQRALACKVPLFIITFLTTVPVADILYSLMPCKSLQALKEHIRLHFGDSMEYNVWLYKGWTQEFNLEDCIYQHNGGRL